MTNGEILQTFIEEHPSMKDKLADYRPLCLDFVHEKEGVVIWLKNDDIILYFPKQRNDSQLFTGKDMEKEAYKVISTSKDKSKCQESQ